MFAVTPSSSSFLQYPSCTASASESIDHVGAAAVSVSVLGRLLASNSNATGK